MAKFYVFDLPSTVLEGIEPFKVDFDTEKVDKEPESDSESEGGSESDSESDRDDETDIYAVAKPTGKTNFSLSVTQYNDDFVDESVESWRWANRAHITGSPYAYFSNPKCSQIPTDKVLAIYKSWFDQTQIVEDPVTAVTALPRNGKSAVLMVGSGHFAGAIIEHRRLKHKTNVSNPLQNVNVIVSKTFHRYTTRRKQGGAQSTKDNATGKANSAGSTIRRTNERMLQDEVRTLLANWAPQLRECYRIFVRAPGRANRQMLVGYPGSPVASDDERISRIPFATKRPTLDECKSVWYQLTQAEVVDIPKPAESAKPRDKEVKTKNNDAEGRQSVKKVVDEATPEEKLTLQIVDLIKRSKLPALRTLLEKNGPDFRLQPERRYVAFPTPLLYAAHLDKASCVTAILSWGADLMVRNGDGVYIGELAGPRAQQALQVARKAKGESAFNWNKAKVGKPMTREEIAAVEKQEKQRLSEERRLQEQAVEKREKKDRMEKLIRQHGTGKLTGGQYEASRGLSADDLRQVERERRARAAEARLARLGN